jgi:hypothetical protein
MKTIFKIVLLLLLLGLIFYFAIASNEQYSKKYSGIVLFDIDGTLSTGIENEKVVDYFLDNNFAVGIITAGAMYHPGNLHKFSWMPKNLYNFMVENSFNTFNNVVTNIVNGKKELIEIPTHSNLNFYENLGFKKAILLEKNAKIYNIHDYNKIILVDNDPSYIKGAKKYNSKYKIICGGKPCSNYNLTLESVI